jgi:hypothetical protein
MSVAVFGMPDAVIQAVVAVSGKDFAGERDRAWELFVRPQYTHYPFSSWFGHCGRHLN